MSYSINQNFLQGIPQNPYRNGIGAYEGVVCHATACYNDSDESERNYEQGHWNDAFVHGFVDEDSITQTAPFGYLAWGAGHTANQRYVQLELCQTYDQAKFQSAYDRYVWLTAKVLADRKLGVIDGVTLLSHKQVSDMWHESTHQDPIDYFASHGLTWAQHVANVKAEYDRQTTPSPVYTVVAGDTLWGISRTTGLSVANLKAINGLTSDTLQIGQVLQLKSVPVPATRTIFLPADNPTWTVYKLGHPCIKSNPDNVAGQLAPAQFGGLTYTILQDNGNWVFEIQTQSFGRVQIYGEPNTGAIIK
jgi:N-acetylmuramoyl-L-alanine amidase CwlA